MNIGSVWEAQALLEYLRGSYKKLTVAGYSMGGHVFLRIFLSQKQHLGDHQVGDVVVNRRADEDDVVAEQSGIIIV